MPSDAYISAGLDELRALLESVDISKGDLIPLMREAIADWTPDDLNERIGTVVSVGDGIARVTGLKEAMYKEILIFEGGVRGMVMDLDESEVRCILFNDDSLVREGSSVRRTGRNAAVPVGDAFIGRVVDPLGSPIDGLGAIAASDMMPIDVRAPGVMARQPVALPLRTGILAIDSMFPIGRGQRELIIGDRQTGKTTIAIDTILNQHSEGVICIYVAIGQKTSSVARIVEELRSRGAMDYTIVVAATAADTAPLQYIAPYSATSIGEYFMRDGRDVLIIYDDLSKHAAAYRAISLLLERSPGREAYPGDVFYLHSRLLECSAHLADELGGGSMTALPIVETLAGDVSAYIPTNVISITDGQIFLENSLFLSGQVPAINVGISVSRVGSDAQTKVMKKAAGGLKLKLAVYRELEIFTQFASDLDELTKKQLKEGESLMRLLRQARSSPYSEADQVMLLTMAMQDVLTELDADEIAGFDAAFLTYARQKLGDIYRRIDLSHEISDDDRRLIVDTARAFRDNEYRSGLKNGNS